MKLEVFSFDLSLRTPDPSAVGMPVTLGGEHRPLLHFSPDCSLSWREAWQLRFCGKVGRVAGGCHLRGETDLDFTRADLGDTC